MKHCVLNLLNRFVVGESRSPVATAIERRAVAAGLTLRRWTVLRVISYPLF